MTLLAAVPSTKTVFVDGTPPSWCDTAQSIAQLSRKHGWKVRCVSLWAVPFFQLFLSLDEQYYNPEHVLQDMVELCNDMLVETAGNNNT